MGICQEEEPPKIEITQKAAEASEDADSESNDEEGKEMESHAGKKLLIVEQVKVVDQLNNLRVVYPSRTDLESKKFKVDRSHDQS